MTANSEPPSCYLATLSENPFSVAYTQPPVLDLEQNPKNAASLHGMPSSGNETARFHTPMNRAIKSTSHFSPDLQSVTLLKKSKYSKFSGPFVILLPATATGDLPKMEDRGTGSTAPGSQSFQQTRQH